MGGVKFATVRVHELIACGLLADHFVRRCADPSAAPNPA